MIGDIREVIYTRFIKDVKEGESLTDYETLMEVIKSFKQTKDTKIIQTKLNNKNAVIIIRGNDILIYKYKMIF